MKWVASLDRLLARHIYPLAIVVWVAATTFESALRFRPFQADNLIALSLGARPDPTTFFTGSFVSYLPAYRPLAYLTIWVQYQIVGLRIGYYSLFNILVWVGCVLCVYAFVYILTRSRLSATIVALLMLLDGRQYAALIWIGERQSTLAVLFGLSALLLTLASCRDKSRYLTWLGIFLLLLASSLSKEFGLAFSGALVMFLFFTRSKDWKVLSIIAVAAVVIYFAMRLFLAGGAAGADICEGMGFLSSYRVVCYGDLDTGARIQQHLYNVGATFVGTIFPSLFDGAGTLRRASLRSLAFPALVFLMAFLGWAKMPRRTLPMLVLIAFNAVLNFMFYRTRNHLAGMAGLYATAGVGLAYVLSFVRNRRGTGLISATAMCILFIWLHRQTTGQMHSLQSYQNYAAALDACVAAREYAADIDRDLVRQIKIKYGMSNPDCTLESP